MKLKLRNLWLALLDQGPPRRFFRNFFVTGNARGLFYKNSHISYESQKPKVMYPTRPSAERAAASMTKKRNVHFSVYKCIWCDGYHLGRSRDARLREKQQNEK